MNTGQLQPEAPTRGSAGRTLLFLLFGPCVWGAHHVVMYASHTLVCFFGAASSSIFGLQPMPAVAVGAAAVALVLGAAPLLAPDMLSRILGMQPGTDWRFYCAATALLSVLAVTGVAWTAGLTLLVPACNQ
jgi:hypothetical protein